MSAHLRVVEQYPGIVSRCRWHALDEAGGYSGAEVWRGELDGEPLFALKRWPNDFSAARLRQIHTLIATAQHLPFVPRILPTLERDTLVDADGCIWDVCTWMPGEACLQSPSETRLKAACAAIGQLHDVWKPHRPTFAPCPAVERRLRLFDTWEASTHQSNYEGLWKEAAMLLRDGIPPARQALQPWRVRPLPLQHCLADIHREHVLFTGDTITGIIDYGAMKIDNVAADAARYLGDAASNDRPLFNHGCELFARHHGEGICPVELIAVLDRTGTLAAIANWLLKDERSARIETRLARLVERCKRLLPNRLE